MDHVLSPPTSWN